jgi:hypothetical protein
MSDVFEDRQGRVIASAFSRTVGPRIDGELISNALMARSELMSSLLDPRRDVDAECHYPATRDITPEQYKQLYDRDSIACRVVQCIAKESWQGQPTVYEAEDPEVTTPFEEAWDALQPMNSGNSWYKAEEAGSIWEYLLRADILSGIGHFGVLLLGFDDGRNLQEPVEGATVVTNANPEGCNQYKPCSVGEVRKVLSKNKIPVGKSSSAGFTETSGAYIKDKGGVRVHHVPTAGFSREARVAEEDSKLREYAGYLEAAGFGTEVVDSIRASKERTVPHVKIHGHRVPTSNRLQYRDCYLTKSEEASLRELPNLNEMERVVLNQLAKQREVIVNSMQAQQDRRNGNGREYMQTDRPQDAQVFGEATSGDQVQGTDRQYSQEFGLRGEADYSPGLSGTDQQYFGVQFGPTELPSKETSSKKLRLLFLRPFDESLVQIVRYEWNINNPRFGMPVMYRITLNDPREQHSGIGLPMATVFVHWSRVIHLADNLNSSEIFGAPRMRPVLNRLLDLQKIYGASAEGYWQAAFTGLALETHPQLGGDVTIDAADVRNQIENYVNSLQRYLALTGMSAHTLAPAVSDPTSQIAGHMEAICIQLGIPVRIFKGSERGELASSQDDASWNDRLKARQQGYITPRIIVPFVDRLIAVGVLPEPSYVEPEEPVVDEFGYPIEDQTEDQYPWEEQGDGEEPEEDPYDLDQDGDEVDSRTEDSDPGQGDEGDAVGSETDYGDEPAPDEEDEDDRTPAGLIKNTAKPLNWKAPNSRGNRSMAGGITADLPGGEHYEIVKTVQGKHHAVYVKRGRKDAGGRYFSDQQPVDTTLGVHETQEAAKQAIEQHHEQHRDELGRFAENAFCATGPGGGKDPSCGGSGQATPSNPDAGKYPHLAHLMNGQRVGSSGHDKKSAYAKAQGLRAKGVYAGVLKDPRGTRGKQYMVMLPVHNRRCSPILNDDGKQVGMRTKTGYSVVWPDLDSNTDKDKAMIASTKTQALAAYVAGNVESVMPLMEFYTKILGMTDEEAGPLVQAAEEQQMQAEQQAADQQAAQAGQLGIGPDGLPIPGMEQPDLDQGAEADYNDGEPTNPFDQVGNAFCPTGEGGGVDPSCGSGEGDGTFSGDPGGSKLSRTILLMRRRSISTGGPASQRWRSYSHPGMSEPRTGEATLTTPQGSPTGTVGEGQAM